MKECRCKNPYVRSKMQNLDTRFKIQKSIYKNKKSSENDIHILQKLSQAEIV